MAATPESTPGERLLRSDEAARAAREVGAEVRSQLGAALRGPLTGALTAWMGVTQRATGNAPGQADQSDQASQDAAQATLGTEVPRRFIGTGAALAAAYQAIASGDDVRAAGSLLCAQQLLFPNDPDGVAAVAGAVDIALRPLTEDESLATSAPGEGGTEAQQPSLDAMQRTVMALAERLEGLYLGAAAHVEVAALGSRSWRAMTFGAGPGSGSARTIFGPFIDGLVRWAYYLAVALRGVREDNWALAGAAVIAARSEVRRGTGDLRLL